MNVKDFMTVHMSELFAPPKDTMQRFAYTKLPYRFSFYEVNSLKHIVNGCPYTHEGSVLTFQLNNEHVLTEQQVSTLKRFCHRKVLIALSTPIETIIFLDGAVGKIADTVAEIIEVDTYDDKVGMNGLRDTLVPIVLREEGQAFAIPRLRRSDLAEYMDKPLSAIWYHYRDDDRLNGFCEIFYKGV